jgi:hypothetical protein
MAEEKSIREEARKAAITQAKEMLRLENEMNYHTLYVDHDRKVWWSKEVSRDTLLMDNEADDFRPLRYLVQVGMGSGHGNGDSDEDEIDYITIRDAEQKLSDAIDDIPQGYFVDEYPDEYYEDKA